MKTERARKKSGLELGGINGSDKRGLRNGAWVIYSKLFSANRYF